MSAHDTDPASTDPASVDADAIPAEGFDQTNGLAPGLDGDSDGTAESDDLSAAERAETPEGEAIDSVAEREARGGAAADDIQGIRP